MGLLSFLKRSSAPSGARPVVRSAGKNEPIEQARIRARHRLIGAVVLLGIAVIGFPLLFETEPRPIPVDLPIVIPKKENAPPLKPARPARTTEGAGAAASSSDRDADGVLSGVPRAVGAAKDEGAESLTAERTRPASPRFDLQIGAYAEPGSVREVRQKVERMGLPTYTHEIDTSRGKRIRVRVGPFASREEAQRAAARLRASGLQTVMLPQPQ